jgi:DNA primase catalytic core
MARIAEEELERLKRETDLAGLVRARGVELEPHGKDLLGLCPFHPDTSPSLVVTPEKNLWHCLGACRTGGDVISWVMKAEGVSFRHAVAILQERYPSSAASKATNRSPRPDTDTRLPSLITRQGVEDQELLNRVIGYYHDTLKKSPEALSYLEKRGLKPPEMIDRFKLGYANRTLGYRLPEKARKEGAQLRERLQRLGILRESGHEHFTGSVVIPVLDETGNVLEVYGRKIRDDLRKGTPYHLYLPGPHKGVWNREALQASREIILCESLIDALTFWCAGFRNVTASYGIEGFTEDHLEAFKRYGTERVLIAYDRDEAGERAAESLSRKLLREGIDCYRIQFPRGMDANEYALKVRPASKSLDLVIRNALWLGKGKGPVREERQAAKEKKAGDIEEKETSEGSPPLSPSLAASVPPERTVPDLEESESEPVSVMPPAPSIEIPAEVKAQEVVIRFGDRRWRIRGLARNMSYEQLRVNVLCARGDGFYVDTLDLYAARQRAMFVKQAAEETGVKEEVVKNDLGRVLLKLEELQEEQIRKALEPKRKPQAMTEKDRAEALALLKDPDLTGRILADFARCGVVGEETNKLTGYLAAVSRKLEEPLAAIVQSSSAAGKTLLMEAILAFVPEEDRIKYSAMTGQSLFYMGEADLKHKVLAIVEEEGAERASYALKLLQSEGELTIASTGKDPSTGKLVTHEYRVEGPVMIFLTTTAIDIDEELLNRCMVLTVDEDRRQTRAIHNLQRQAQTLEGLLARKDRDRILKVHRNAQRLLKPLVVANPHAPRLTFLDARTRTRRDHVKYLTLIRTIALLNQHQRPVKTVQHNGRRVEYIEVTVEDIATANRLAHEVLGRTLDELPPQTSRLLALVDGMVRRECKRLDIDRADYRFSRRTVREYTGWGNTQLKVHLARLEEMEYLVVHRGGRGQSFVYELVYAGEGQDGARFVPGLLDVSRLKEKEDYDKKKSALDQRRSGLADEKSGAGRPLVGPQSGRGRDGENSLSPCQQGLSADSREKEPKTHIRGEEKNGPSYVPCNHTQGFLPLAQKEEGPG